jgi:anthranilate phosphoribosyltransferase
VIERVLAGRDSGAARTAVVLNAAAGLLVADVVDSWPEAVQRALETIETGAAAAALEALRAATNSV